MKSATENSVLDQPVCPHCAKPITLQQHFCPRCNAPLTSFATTGPYEQVLSQGYAVRAGVTRPANPLVLFGMWLIFAPTMLIAFISAAVLLFGVIDGMERHATARLVGLAVSGFWVLLAATILGKSTRNYLRQQKSNSGENGV
jgi:hypothetical protein